MFRQLLVGILRSKCCIAGMLFFVGTAVSVFSAEREIGWTEDYDAAVQRAASSNRVILLHFYGDYCPPCKLLDKKTFHDPALVSAINENVVPVKINADRRRDLATKYNVNRWPTDVYLFPNGDEVYRGISDQDPAVYTKKIHRIALRHRDWTVEREAMAKSAQRHQDKALAANTPQIETVKPVHSGTEGHSVKSQTAAWTASQTPSQPVPTVQQSAPTNHRVIDNPFAAQQVVAKSVGTQRESSIESPPPSPPIAETHIIAETIGLDGYCPVMLIQSIGHPGQSVWVVGSPKYAVRHRGRIYYCASDQARKTLLSDPDRYAPCLSGFDLVHFFKTGLLVDGKCEFGCIQSDTSRVFLFSNVANYLEFERDNELYSRLLDRVTPERVAVRSSETQMR